MNSIKRLLKIVITPFVFLILIGLLILHFASPFLIIKPRRVTSDPFFEDSLPSAFEKISITSKDNFQLKGYYISSQKTETLGSIIYLHGIGGSKAAFVGVAAELAAEGFEGVLLDNRAHGESGGDYCTYGYHEKEDVVQIINFLEQEKGAKNIGVWGSSMGGAVGLLSLEHDKRLKFGIIESTFHDMLTVVLDYKKRWSGFRIKWMGKSALSRAAEVAKFDYKKVKPGESAKNIHQPILLAHGDSDANISVEYGKEIFKNLASENKELVIVKGADHHDLGAVGGQKYYEQTLSFLKKYAVEK